MFGRGIGHISPTPICCYEQHRKDMINILSQLAITDQAHEASPLIDQFNLRIDNFNGLEKEIFRKKYGETLCEIEHIWFPHQSSRP